MRNLSQRDKADGEVEKIKSMLKISKLDYFIQESPYSVSIQIRKTFIQDFSPLLVERSSRMSTSTPFHSQHQQLSPQVTPQSPIFGHDDVNNSSGFHSQHLSCSSCEEKSEELGEVKKIMEVKEATILDYEKKDKRIQSEVTNLKSERQTKAEQIKQKNKTIESLKSKLENLSNEKDSMKDNFTNKVQSLEKHNKHLTDKLEEAKQEAKNERKKKKT